MGWSINLVDNTVDLPKDIAPKLFEAAPEHFMDDPDSVLDDDGYLMFDSDAMEHMDYLHDDRILAVLKEAEANGKIVFSSNDGDNRGTWWSYNFEDGDMTETSGKLRDLIPG